MKKQKNYPLYSVKKLNDFRDMLSQAVAENGNGIAFRYKGNDKKIVDVTYKNFKNDVDSLSAALYRKGIADRHVAIIGENSYSWINIYLSMMCCPGVFVPIDAKLPTEEIINVVNISDSEVLFYSDSFAQAIESNIKLMPKVKNFIRYGGNGACCDLSFAELLSTGRKELESTSPESIYTGVNGKDDLKLLVYTSGTTGVAKGVMLSEKNLISGVYYGLQVSDVFDSCLSVLPYHHTYEAVCGILVGLHRHVTICINDSIRNVSENLNIYKPAYILIVPLFVEAFYKKIWKEATKTKKAAALKAMIKLSNALRCVGIDMRKTLFKSIRDGFGGNLRKIVCGGAPIRPELGDFFDAIGITLVNGYGITECSPLVSANRDYYNDCSTVGVKLPCCDIKIADPDATGTGEILVKGDIVMLGYYKNPDLTAEVMHDGWFSTGDYGCLDAEGRICMRGRKKNIIVLNNGENIYPEEIENYILSLPLVKEVVVSAIESENGDVSGLGAEVYMNEEIVKGGDVSGFRKEVVDSVKKLSEKLPIHKRVGKIIFRDEAFVKTTSGKIKR